jgi:hypothetical protein
LQTTAGAPIFFAAALAAINCRTGHPEIGKSAWLRTACDGVRMERARRVWTRWRQPEPKPSAESGSTFMHGSDPVGIAGFASPNDPGQHKELAHPWPQLSISHHPEGRSSLPVHVLRSVRGQDKLPGVDRHHLQRTRFPAQDRGLENDLEVSLISHACRNQPGVIWIGHEFRGCLGSLVS